MTSERRTDGGESGLRLDWPTPVTSRRGTVVKDGKAGRYLGEEATNWPTPDANAINLTESPETWLARREELKARGINGNGAGMPLGIAASAWQSPMARDARGPKRGATAEGAEPLAMQAGLWPTPRSRESGAYQRDHGAKDGTQRQTLTGAIRAWATPTSSTATIGDMEQARYSGSDQRRPSYAEASHHGRQPPTTSTPGEPCSPDGLTSPPRRRLNPTFVEHLMGFVLGWTCICGGSGDKACSRAKRLRALGNAMVPVAAATAWARLMRRYGSGT